MNEGKKFEQIFKKSAPDYCLTIRLNDSAQAFKKSDLAKFTPAYCYKQQVYMFYLLLLQQLLL